MVLGEGCTLAFEREIKRSLCKVLITDGCLTPFALLRLRSAHRLKGVPHLEILLRPSAVIKNDCSAEVVPQPAYEESKRDCGRY
jgi:hypothetical protein